MLIAVSSHSVMAIVIVVVGICGVQSLSGAFVGVEEFDRGVKSLSDRRRRRWLRCFPAYASVGGNAGHRKKV
jgi:hypothetical protein